jgi:hypothetical protein
MKPLYDRVKNGSCTGCAHFVRIVGRRYGLCVRGGVDELERRGRYPVAPNWPVPCKHYEESEAVREARLQEAIQDFAEQSDPASWMGEQAERDAR